MADNTGKWISVGGRLTYHPPFVNQRGFNQPWDECVPTTGLNLINVAFLGQKPPTTAEIKGLRDSIDASQPSEGWHTSHFVDMAKERYGLNLSQENVAKDQMAQRLSHGWAVSVGINLEAYPQQPWDNGAKSTSGHRILLLGYDSATSSTKVLDPMFSQGPGYRGFMQPLQTVWHAMSTGSSDWRYQQVWIREAERVITTVTILATLTPPRTVTLSGGGALHPVFDLAHQDGQPIKNVQGTNPVVRQFDQIAQIAQQPNQCWKPEGGPFIRLRGTNVEGLWINATSGGVTADLSIPGCADNDCADAYNDGYAQGMQDEETDWNEWLGDAPRAVARATLYEMVDYGGGVDDDGVGWTDADTLVTTSPEDPDEPRVPPTEAIT